MSENMRNYVNYGYGSRRGPSVDTFEQKEAAKKKKRKGLLTAGVFAGIAAAGAGIVMLAKKGKLDCIKNFKVPFAKGKTVGDFFKKSTGAKDGKISNWFKNTFLKTPEERAAIKKASIAKKADKKIAKMDKKIKGEQLANDVNKAQKEANGRVASHKKSVIKPAQKKVNEERTLLERLNIFKRVFNPYAR